MKKKLLSLLLLAFTCGASAQFEAGTFYINTSLSELDMNYSKKEEFKINLQGNFGVFAADNLLLYGQAEADYSKNSVEDKTTLGAGVRYYFINGLFTDAAIIHTRHNFDDGSDSDFGCGLQFGYCYFLSRTVTLEPALYYRNSFTSKSYNQFGLKIGFGFYF